MWRILFWQKFYINLCVEELPRLVLHLLLVGVTQSFHSSKTGFWVFLVINFIYLFIYFWLHWVFVAVCGHTLQLQRVGATLRCGAQASHCGDFSCCGARALGVWASVVVAHRLSSCGSWALERKLSSCGARAQLLCSMWDFPKLGLEPMSPALAGGFLTTREVPRTGFYANVLVCESSP